MGAEYQKGRPNSRHGGVGSTHPTLFLVFRHRYPATDSLAFGAIITVLSNVDADGSYIFLGEMNKGVDVMNDSGCSPWRD
jgi:hypothetical protein